MTKWTAPQQDAIDARNKNILVSAAAGSGKTAVLVERVKKLIVDEAVPIDKLLIVTFTNAAASEMRSKIQKELQSLLTKTPNVTNIKRQLSLLPNANICTIDSFCIKLVRENFFNLNIEQDFRIMDDAENNIIEKDILDQIIEEYYNENDRVFLNLVEMMSDTKDDKNLSNNIIKVKKFTSSQPFPSYWLDKCCEFYNPENDLENGDFAKFVYNEAEEKISYALELINQSYEAFSNFDEMRGRYREVLEFDRSIYEKLEILIKEKNWDEIYSYVRNVSWQSLPRKNGYESEAKEITKANREIYKKLISNDFMSLFNIKSQDYVEECEKLYPLVLKYVEITKKLFDRVLEVKKELNSYTFNDIEHFALDLLGTTDGEKVYKTKLAQEFQDNFVEIFVDEYQDTNAAQDYLFYMLSNGHNRFMVGDIKQSIYRFRLAMPNIFSKMKDDYTLYSSASPDKKQKIILSNNFRSRKGICDYTNFVFSHCMTKSVGDVDYNEDEMLYPSAIYPKSDIPCAQINIVETPDTEDKVEYEAHQIAKLILEKINNKEQVKENDTETRNITFGDFAILFRALKQNLPVYEKFFAQYGIPTVSDNKSNLFSYSEIIILMNLIRTIDNPIQDVPLLATLMSTFYGYTADDLALAKVEHPSRNLYSSISKSERFEKFILDLKKYREYSSSMSVENLVRKIVDETSYLSVISAMGDQEQRMLNVLKFIDLAKNFDNGENVGLTSFIRYIDNIIKNGYSIEGASVTHIGENSVNLVTIHKSKGLEYPVVILANSCHQYNFTDSNEAVQLNNKYGFGFKIYNEDLMCRYDSIQRSVIRDANKLELMSENLRVLYVAITRAKEQFITFYSTNKLEDTINKLSKNIINGKISPAVVKKMKCDGDIILTTALMHKDAIALRDLCTTSPKVDIYADFPMQISFSNDDALDDNIEIEKAEVDEKLMQKFKEKLCYKYDRISISNFVSKRTASSLDDSDNDFEFLTSKKPAFLSKANMTPAQKGTAMHTFMQYCDYKCAKANLENEISRLQKNKFITDDQAKVLDREKLSSLFESDFANRMFNSDRIYREIKVSSFVPVNELEQTDFDDKVLVQGIADCVFEENGELVLVDYKTDRVNDDLELLDRYKKQIAFYKMSISKTLKKPVKEALLYSFYLNKVCIYK